MKAINIDGKNVGPGYPVYLIAEIGSNHCGDKTVVKKLIDIAAIAGFDAVKFQTYDPLEVFSGKITTAELNMDPLYGYKYWWEVARDCILMPREWFGEMFAYAREKNLQVFSTVHSAKDAEFIMQFNPPVFKVASLDVTYLDFLVDLAGFKKPIILSTGMHYLGEIEEAVSAILNHGNGQLALLHCVSNYPPRPEDVNLYNIPMLQKAFDLPVGFSDHHPDNSMDVAAVALGACIIEKHVTLDRSLNGPDHPFALDPDAMMDLVKSIRDTEKALGTSKRVLSESELLARTVTRRSFVARIDIKKGEVLSRQNIKITRPGTGIHPKFKDLLFGRKAIKDIAKEDIISWEMIE
ncbi:MAG: N-acetylneuraminate synthase family protein [Acidobacteria bacterium]|jgi:sialic acid synthase SpsE|nr:N-acetylneuraminate synthase family protein [Acidobacteriota bacterium]